MCCKAYILRVSDCFSLFKILKFKIYVGMTSAIVMLYFDSLVSNYTG